MFQRTGNATVGFNTQVSVLDAAECLPDEANAFVVDTGDGAAPAGPGGGPLVKVTWPSDTEVVIQHDSRARVFLAVKEIQGVRVSYERLDESSH